MKSVPDFYFQVLPCAHRERSRALDLFNVSISGVKISFFKRYSLGHLLFYF